MQNLNRKIIFLISLVLIFKGVAVYAQETKPPETSLEAELNQAQTPAPTTAEPASPIPTEATTLDISETPAAPVETNISETNVDYSDVSGMDELYAMNGYSLGLVVLSQNYNLNAEFAINGGQKVDLSVKSPDFQSVGVMARYAILPLNRIGTDLNATIASSVNHNEAGLPSSVTTLKAEVNLGYAIPVSSASAIYALAGGGYEVVFGNELKDVFTPGGSTWQIGGGASIGKKLNVELAYSYAIHSIPQKFFDNAEAAAIANGATSVGNTGVKNFVQSNIIQGRLVYNY